MTVKLVGSTSGSVSLQAPASTTGGAHRVLTLPDADGTVAVGDTGKILQVLETVKTDTASNSFSTSVWEPTFLRQSITTTGSNKVLIHGQVSLCYDSSGNAIRIGLMKDESLVSGAVGDTSNSNRRATAESRAGAQYAMTTISFSYLDSPSAGTHEYHFQISHSSGGNRTVYINRVYDGNTDSSVGRAISLIRCMEVAA